MQDEMVIVFKDRKNRSIQTYINTGGHGARMKLEDFISLIAETYGSPATTMTRATHLERLLEASGAIVRDMKVKTKEVAAINMEPKVSN